MQWRWPGNQAIAAAVHRDLPPKPGKHATFDAKYEYKAPSTVQLVGRCFTGAKFTTDIARRGSLRQAMGQQTCRGINERVGWCTLPIRLSD